MSISELEKKYYSELYHYGVKGMKWGVRHDKPTSGRRRTGKKEDHGRRQVSKMYSKKAPSIGELDDVDIQLMLEGGIYLTAILAFGLYYAKRAGVFKKKHKAEEIKKTNTTKEEDLKLINSSNYQTSQETLEYIEAGGDVNTLSFEQQKTMLKDIRSGAFSNCVYCSSAAALRRKGYDVVAEKSPLGGHQFSEVITWWKGAKAENLSGKTLTNPKDMEAFRQDTLMKNYSKDRETGLKELNDKLLSYGDSYGEMHVTKNTYGGHSVEFEVVNGKVKVYDNQVGKSYNSLEEFFSSPLSKDAYIPGLTTWVRLDNCEPDMDKLLKKMVVRPR